MPALPAVFMMSKALCMSPAVIPNESATARAELAMSSVAAPDACAVLITAGSIAIAWSSDLPAATRVSSPVATSSSGIAVSMASRLRLASVAALAPCEASAVIRMRSSRRSSSANAVTADLAVRPRA